MHLVDSTVLGSRPVSASPFLRPNRTALNPPTDATKTCEITVTANAELQRMSYPMHYFAKAPGLPEQILCVRVQATPAVTWGLAEGTCGISLLVTAAGGETLPPGPAGRVIPHIRGHYAPQQQELHFEDITAGMLVRGQRFLENTLRQCLDLFPDSRSTMLANVLHEPTRSLMLRHLEQTADKLLSIDATAGPLARGMARAGFDEIEVVPESGRRTYVGLRGRRRATAAVDPRTHLRGVPASSTQFSWA